MNTLSVLFFNDAIVFTESCFSNITTLGDLKLLYSDACTTFNSSVVEETMTMEKEFTSTQAFNDAKTLWHSLSFDAGNHNAPSKYIFFLS